MEYQTITLDITDDVAVLTLNRADKMNALNTQMRAEIADAARTAGKEARVLVLTGAGRAFCSARISATGPMPPTWIWSARSATNTCPCCRRSMIARSRQSAP